MRAWPPRQALVAAGLVRAALRYGQRTPMQRGTRTRLTWRFAVACHSRAAGSRHNQSAGWPGAALGRGMPPGGGAVGEGGARSCQPRRRDGTARPELVIARGEMRQCRRCSSAEVCDRERTSIASTILLSAHISPRFPASSLNYMTGGEVRALARAWTARRRGATKSETRLTLSRACARHTSVNRARMAARSPAIASQPASIAAATV